MDQQQRQQLESLAQQQLKYIVRCQQCHTLYGYKPDLLVNKPVDDYLVEVGIHCPSCHLFHRVYWMNPTLIELRQELGETPDRKGKRQFAHLFDKLQRRMRLKSAIHPG